jgi:hypothetical protein
MSKRKTPKAWVAYKFAKVGKRLGKVYGETEKQVLRSLQAARQGRSGAKAAL